MQTLLKGLSVSWRNQQSKKPSTRAAPIEIRKQAGEQHRERQGEASNPYISMFTSQACTESRSKEITDRIANMIALDMKPIRMVEDEGFHSLLAFLEPGYKIPSRKHFSKLIHQ